jgi:putative transposase
MSRGERASMIDRTRSELSIARQCALVGVSRSSFYDRPAAVRAETLSLMREIDEQYLRTPFFGSRRMTAWLRARGHAVNRKRVRRLMRLLGLAAIYQRPRTSRPAPDHKTYPYLLRDLVITRPNQVWCADITYIPMARGFLYLVAVMDWASRYVLAWRLANTLDAAFCVEALEVALLDGVAPEIVNTDQGSQFTAATWIETIEAGGAQVSMDGKGRFTDNIFIERLWRSLKYEEVYLHAYETVADAKAGIGRWIRFYNAERPHQALGYRTPEAVFATASRPVDMMDKPVGLPTSPQAPRQQTVELPV